MEADERCALCGEVCPFCDKHTFEARFLLDTEEAYAMFSFWPVAPYHALIIPHRHVENESTLNSREILSIFKVKEELVRLIKQKTGLEAYNFGVNVGMAAGQTVPHLHYHIIFRQRGDVPDPKGGVRNVLPGKEYPAPEMKQIEEVQQWTDEFRSFLRPHSREQSSSG